MVEFVEKEKEFNDLWVSYVYCVSFKVNFNNPRFLEPKQDLSHHDQEAFLGSSIEAFHDINSVDYFLEWLFSKSSSSLGL